MQRYYGFQQSKRQPDVKNGQDQNNMMQNTGGI